MMLNRFLKIGMIGACLSMTAAFADELVVNGSFETGDFTGWKVNNQVNSGGSFFVYSLVGVDYKSPLTANTLNPPPDGQFAAVSDQYYTASDILFQDIAIPSGVASATLKFTYYYESVGSPFVTALDLDRTTFPNKQFRIDIMKPSAPEFSVAPSDVLMNLVQSQPSDPLSNTNNQTLTFDLTQFAGQTIRLRFASVTNQGTVYLGIDGVSVTVPTSTLILPPSNLRACVKKNRFLSQSDVFTALNWNASRSASVAGYRIFRNGVLIATVSGRTLCYEDHCGCGNTYQISAVDSAGNESQRI